MKNKNYLLLSSSLFLLFLFWNNPVLAAQPLKAEVVSQSQTVLRLRPGQSFTVSVKIKNSGTSAWQKTGASFAALNTADEKLQKTIKSKFQHKNWKKWWRPTGLSKSVKPGETAIIKFAVTAPFETGRFTEHFSLAKAGYGFIDGGNFSLTIISFPQISIKSTAPESIEIEQGKTKTINVQFENTSKISWDAQKFPLSLSVGDLKSLSSFTDSSWTNNKTQFKANDILDLIDSTGAVILTVNPSSLISVAPIDAASFSVSAENKTINVSSPARFAPRNQTTVSEITTFERRPAWNTTLNDNLFRGTIEFLLLPNSTTYWAIEEVALEEYLRGIAEVSDSDNPIYLKTMMIASRTYAAFLNIYKTKHRTEGYDINMTTDQVYRGYNLELRAPNTTKAVLETEGQILIHPYAVDENNLQAI